MEIDSDITHGRLTKRLASHILGKVIKKDTVIVNEYSLRPDYMSRWYNLPIFIVVFNDGQWSDVKRSVLDTSFFIP